MHRSIYAWHSSYVNPNTLHEDEAISHKKCTIIAIEFIKSVTNTVKSHWKIQGHNFTPEKGSESLK